MRNALNVYFNFFREFCAIFKDTNSDVYSHILTVQICFNEPQ